MLLTEIPANDGKFCRLREFDKSKGFLVTEFNGEKVVNISWLKSELDHIRKTIDRIELNSREAYISQKTRSEKLEDRVLANEKALVELNAQRKMTIAIISVIAATISSLVVALIMWGLR